MFKIIIILELLLKYRRNIIGENSLFPSLPTGHNLLNSALSLSLFSCIILVSIAAANKLFAAVTA
jgi:hypothetical protein